jgi:hypothetical protein
MILADIECITQAGAPAEKHKKHGNPIAWIDYRLSQASGNFIPTSIWLKSVEKLTIFNEEPINVT